MFVFCSSLTAYADFTGKLTKVFFVPSCRDIITTLKVPKLTTVCSPENVSPEKDPIEAAKKIGLFNRLGQWFIQYNVSSEVKPQMTWVRLVVALGVVQQLENSDGGVSIVVVPGDVPAGDYLAEGGDIRDIMVADAYKLDRDKKIKYIFSEEGYKKLYQLSFY